MDEIMVNAIGVSKKYRTGQIGSTTLREEMQRLRAKIRKKEDPTKKIGYVELNSEKEFWAVDDVSFKVYKGERVGIIGHNGAGKSTLLKLITKITAPSKGRIGLNGNVASMLEVGTGFHPELTGRENIYINGAILGMKKAEVDKKIDDIIEFSECGKFIDTPVKRYSSGMYVKLAFAVAAHLDSEILIMDEVLAVGDMKFQKKCIKKMTAVSEDEKRTIFYVSHNMNTIRELCSRCIVLDHGKIVYDGEVEKAINIYLDYNTDEGGVVHNLDEIKRENYEYGKIARLREFSFLNKTNPNFEVSEKLRFKVKIKAYSNVKSLKLYFVLNHNQIGQGLAQTYESFADMKAGEEKDYYFSFDISNLAAGRYGLVLNLFNTDILGRHITIDLPNTEIFFEIVESDKRKGIVWKAQFPCVSLSPIEKDNKFDIKL